MLSTTEFASIWRELHIKSADLLGMDPTRALRIIPEWKHDDAGWLDIEQHRPMARQILISIFEEPRLKRAMQAGQLEAFQFAFKLLLMGAPLDQTISQFSQNYYNYAYPDIQSSGIPPIVHYLLHGRQEGRKILGNLRKNLHFGKCKLDPLKPTVYVCLHELSKTGAPIVGLEVAKQASASHNTVALVIRNGPLLEELLESVYAVVISDTPLGDVKFLQPNNWQIPDFAILNSVVSSTFIPLMIMSDIPYVFYVHEYPDYILPVDIRNIGLFSDVVVFSSQTQQCHWKDHFSDFKFDFENFSAVLPQMQISKLEGQKQNIAEARLKLSKAIGIDVTNRKVVLGAGHMHWRKGTDFFLSVASIVKAADPDIVFVWIGDGFREDDLYFGVWLNFHLQNMDDNLVHFIPAGELYETCMVAADVFCLPARIDPLPNVVFDSVKNGSRPIVFEGATGFDDDVYSDHITRVPYGRVDLMANEISNMPIKALNTKIGFDVKFSSSLFLDLHAQVAKSTARSAAKQNENIRYDVAVLMPRSNKQTPQERSIAINKVWKLDRQYLWKSPEQARELLASSSHPTHRSQEIHDFKVVGNEKKVDFGVHIHSHYMDDLEAILQRYALFGYSKKLLVTTDRAINAQAVQEIFSRVKLKGKAIVKNNIGRDILPFLSLFDSDGPGDSQEVWLHIHLKRSIGTASNGYLWRDFLFNTLMGDAKSVSNGLKLISDPTVGLVTAFDPHILGWGKSQTLLKSLSKAKNLSPPDEPILFPMGNMFWTKKTVAKAMLKLVEDVPVPAEPIASDGTILHLIERLWPFVTSECKLKSIYLDNPNELRV